MNVNVVNVQAPPVVVAQPRRPVRWDQGICSCFNDCTTCIIAFCFPCYVIGTNAAAVGDNFWVCGLASCCCPMGYVSRTYIRNKIRKRKGILGSCIEDCCTIYWCYFCTICQEAQEVSTL